MMDFILAGLKSIAGPLVVYVFILPAINIMITITAIKELTGVLGSEIGLMYDVV